MGTVLHWELCKKHRLVYFYKRYQYITYFVLEYKNHKMLWHFRVQIDYFFQESISYLVYVNEGNTTCLIVNVVVRILTGKWERYGILRLFVAAFGTVPKTLQSKLDVLQNPTKFRVSTNLNVVRICEGTAEFTGYSNWLLLIPSSMITFDAKKQMPQIIWISPHTLGVSLPCLPGTNLRTLVHLLTQFSMTTRSLPPSCHGSCNRTTFNFWWNALFSKFLGSFCPDLFNQSILYIPYYRCNPAINGSYKIAHTLLSVWDRTLWWRAPIM